MFPKHLLNIYNFIIVILKKITYNQYYAMNNINDFIICGYYYHYHEDGDKYYYQEYSCFIDDIKYKHNVILILYII